MKQRHRILIILTLALVLFWIILRPKKVPVETVIVARGDVVENLSLDGYFRSLDRRVLSAFADGEVGTITLKVGEPVRKNQVITRIFWDVTPEPLLAPINGVVSRVWRETAGPVRRGEPLIEIIDPKRLEIVVEILTSDAARIRPGQNATVTGFGLKSAIPARVKRLSQAAFVKVSALGIDEERTEVILEPVSPVSNQAPWTGNLFHAEVRIETARVDRCLKVPIGALFRSGNEWSVFVVKQRKAQKRTIARGIDDGHWVEVLEGLSGVERVILYPEDRIREGIGVKLVEPPVARQNSTH
jgi:HlyD family secretion protein